MTTNGYLKGSRRSHNQNKEINRDVSRRLIMERCGVVSTDKLMESACRDEFFVVHDEQRRFHKGKKIMATNIHGKGSKGDYEKSSKNKLDRELVEIKSAARSVESIHTG